MAQIVMDPRSEECVLPVGLETSLVFNQKYLADAFRIYELFIAEFGLYYEGLDHWLAGQIEGGNVLATYDENSKPKAAMVAWHVMDPYDILDDRDKKPEQHPDGKWVYVPFMVTHPKYRGIANVAEVIALIAKRFPTVKRVAFHRTGRERKTKHRVFKRQPRDPKRMHIINIRRK